MTIDDVRMRLTSEWHAQALARNLASVRARLCVNGYFPESLSGAYDGMFPRTVGALAQLFTLTGELDALEHSVEYVFRGMDDNALASVPHVVLPEAADGRVPLGDATDQIDGQAHVILAYALLALARERCAYEDRRWDVAAALMDRSVQSPYLCRNTRWRIHPGLVLNINLEHSREWNYWFAYDFLSQSFVAAALEAMIALAQRRADAEHAAAWREALEFLHGNIHRKMVCERDGKATYLEMLLPSGRAPVAYDGVGWLNLAPIPSGWQGVDAQIFRNTVDFWHQHAAIEWAGPRITACDWTPAGHTNETYGKMLGWDLVYCMQTGEFDRVCAMLDFLEQVNTADLYAEIFTWLPAEQRWKLRDAGNGEQAVWLCWALMRVRSLAGLPVVV